MARRLDCTLDNLVVIRACEYRHLICVGRTTNIITRRSLAVTVFLAVLGSACNRAVPAYSALAGITRIDVRARVSGRDTIVASIANPDSIVRVTDFVNARRDGWEVPWSGVPVPVTTAEFYRGSEFLGHVGAGATFFETQRRDDFASRPATSEEVAAFNALLGITKVVVVPVKHP